jgi:hypothetical protein
MRSGTSPSEFDKIDIPQTASQPKVVGLKNQYCKKEFECPVKKRVHLTKKERNSYVTKIE